MENKEKHSGISPLRAVRRPRRLEVSDVCREFVISGVLVSIWYSKIKGPDYMRLTAYPINNEEGLGNLGDLIINLPVFKSSRKEKTQRYVGINGKMPEGLDLLDLERIILDAVKK